MSCCTYRCTEGPGCPVRSKPAVVKIPRPTPMPQPTASVDLALPTDGRIRYALWRLDNAIEAGLSLRVALRKAWRALRRLP
jgi:hypothetical protein